MDGCKLTPSMLDSRGNRESGWEEGGKRGGFDYIPPKGWKGFGLKVLDNYDNGNNDWLGCDGNQNEWAVAYHGIGTKAGYKVEDATHNIFVGGFKAGGGGKVARLDRHAAALAGLLPRHGASRRDRSGTLRRLRQRGGGGARP